VLDLGAAEGRPDMSPFRLPAVAAPAPRPYQSIGGVLSALCGNRHVRLWTLGLGIFLLAAALLSDVPAPVVPNPRQAGG
jgi:hypothetical protein